jgi:DNA-binding response OmpR family regulator
MKVLVAEDDATTRRLLEALLAQWGYEVTACADGTTAWSALNDPAGPSLAILDWSMPGLDGPEVIRRAREYVRDRDVYLILLTGKGNTDDVVAGFGAGADDYLVKPFQPPELRARMRAGHRVLDLERALRVRVRELEEALANVKQLQGLLPMCSYCKKIRDDRDYWQQVETYFGSHTGATFSHGICPDCYEKHVQPQFDALDGPKSRP